MREPKRMLHVRVEQSDYVRLQMLAQERRQSAAATLRSLLMTAMSSPSPTTRVTQSADGLELQLHVLVAVEQVIALIESFLPEGPGAAARTLEGAALSAQRRLAGELPGAEE
jgi:hypothetical protein